MRTLFALISLLLIGSANGATYYAATNGLAGNTGAIGSPWDLRTMLHKTALITGGDTLWLRGGAYTNAPEGHIPGVTEGWIFDCLIAGLYGNPILIESYPGEWAIIDGKAFGGVTYGFHSSARPTMKVGNSTIPTQGRFITWRNLEFMSSSTEARLSPDDQSIPTSITRSDGMYIFGKSNIVYNCVFHDMNTGILAWEPSSTTTLFGNVIYNNGWQGTPNTHGHGIYTQNGLAGGLKTISTNIMINNFANSIQAYGSSAAEVFHFRILGNMMVNNRIIVGGKVGAEQGDNQIRNNLQYNSELGFLYHFSTNSTTMEVCNNYVAKGQIQGGAWDTALITNNTIISAGRSLFNLVTQPYGNVITAWTVDRNTYIVPSSPTGLWFNDEGVGPMSLATWRTHTGYDLNSTVTAPLPTTNMYVVQPNMFDTNRAHVAVYNWSLASSVGVPISLPGWSALDSCRVRNAQDYWVDVTTNTLVGNTLTLPMAASSHTVALPNGSTTASGPKTFPTFGAFVIERLVSATPTPTNIITITSSAATGATVSATTDLNGNGSGTTSFNRSYLYSTSVGLVAPPTLGTNNFSKWTRAGVDYAFTTNITFIVATNETLVAVYAAPPVTTWTINLSSEDPNSGVIITNTPADNSSVTQGATPRSVVFNDGIVIVFDAPSVAGGNNFVRWDRNSVAYSTKPSITLTANSSELISNPSMFKAVYAPPASNFRDLVVGSVNPNAGVAITVSLADTNGLANGVTGFSRTYGISAFVMITAPSSAGQQVFVSWADENGALINPGNVASSFFMNVNRTRTALYTNQALPVVTLGKASNRRRGIR